MSKWHYGFDPSYGKDAAVLIVYEKPSKLRRWLRRLKIDRSKWEIRVRHRHISNTELYAASPQQPKPLEDNHGE